MLLALGAAEGQTLSRPPFQMVMKDDENVVASLFPALRDRASGVFILDDDGAIAVSAAWLEQGRRDYTGQILYHEYAHRLMFQYARLRYPSWYVEGFAEYFAATFMDDDVVEIGASPLTARVLDRERWVEAAQLLRPKSKAAGGKDLDPLDSPTFYVQSWLLTHYMLADSARTQRFNDYFRRVAAGEDAVAAFEPAIGVPVDKLNDELRSYRDKMYVARLPNSSLPKVELRVMPMPEAEAEAEFDRLIVFASRKGDVGKAALERLRAAVARAGGERAPARMRLALAYAETRIGDVQHALELLSPWAQREDVPFEANRLLGWAWQAQAERAQGAERTQAADQARGFLMAAYRQRRNDAPTLFQLARVLLETKGMSPSVVNAAEAAAMYEPQVGPYAVLAASVQLQSGNRDKAARPLETLANNPHGGAAVERARAALQALKSNQDTADVLALLNGTKKPTTP
ncbi:MAG: hypothetical protein JF607_07625 [Burkholderiales bacterium]|nr:hypothetical protein [Burkholderiales bacterium]